jgi:GTPase KRas
MSGYQGSFRIVVLGAGNVGKSALTIRLVTDNFLEDYDPTIEDLYKRSLTVDDNLYPIEVLDTAGQEEFLPMQDEWIRSCPGVLLAYSIDLRSSFESVKQFREKVVRIKEKQAHIPIVLVGNKCDLPDKEREVPTAEGESLAKAWGCPFFETSAKTKMNNEECFVEVVRQIQKADRMDEDSQKQVNKKKSSFFATYCNIL